MVYKNICAVNNRSIILLGVFGMLFIGGAFYMSHKILPELIRNKIWQMKILEEGTEQWEMFMKMPFAFTFKAYLFDIDNPAEILMGEKPIVKEKGPYVYKLFRWKSEVEKGSTSEISYFSYTRFEFDQELSGDRTQEDFVTVLNTPYLSLLYIAEETQPNTLSMIEGALPFVFGENDGLFVKVKVKDYLFDGLKICEYGGASGGFVAAMICKQMLAQISRSKNMRLASNDTILFAALHYKNNTHLGRFTVKSGISRKEDTAILKKFNGQSYINIWSGEKSSCNKIRGITTVFPNPVNKLMTFESFAEDICRTMKLEYKEEEIVKNILGYRFVSSNSTFNYSLQEDSCFCSSANVSLENTKCLKNGIMDLSPCTGGPVVLSFPHLLRADDEYSASLLGLHPDPQKHETFVTLEPISGFPLKLAQRVQFNMFTRPVPGISFMENITKALIPFMWVEESTTLEDQFVMMLQTKLFNTMKILNIIKWIVVSSGLACVLLAFFLFVYIKSS